MGVTTRATAPLALAAGRAEGHRGVEPPGRAAPVHGARRIGVLVTGRCQGCGACLLTCPEHAIRPAHAVEPAEEARARRPPGAQAGPLAVLDSLCTGCGECVEVCPVDAIEEHRLDASTTGPADESMNVPGNGSDI